MSALVLACGDDPGAAGLRLITERGDVEVRRVPATPAKADVDPVLDALAGRRLVVAGTDADLAAVALRLLRNGQLGEISVAFLPAARSGPSRSAVAALWRLPQEDEAVVDLVLGGEPAPMPLIRDDAGGVLVGRGSIEHVRGEAYCDDDLALRGRARRIEVTPDPAGRDGLLVRVTKSSWFSRRTESFAGRAFQIGCSPIHPHHDGVTHPRAMPRWTWYRHTEDLLAVRVPPTA
ncbi:hypothetical protein EV193_105477 [Herbihabitans rhizosphaerae]|uniref:DAGKc domain-containing protein n=1 Tax=Herbihabitans rhizosphaerae TaxID=1872711 RepID=A0A4Q7KNM7_9PSEU|nr:hypothetical protein [Herbihabitans rhizosphaerae]RZS37917.1 hypothetical protein EV193_105477 [Herbihabitans rhizosphaerae]